MKTIAVFPNTEKIEFNNEYQKQQFMEQLKNNQELLEKF